MVRKTKLKLKPYDKMVLCAIKVAFLAWLIGFGTGLVVAYLMLNGGKV